MGEVVFIDTSVLLCILDVPGKNQDRESIVEEFTVLATGDGNTLILPVATIVETGNHIAQLSNGEQRRTRMAHSANYCSTVQQPQRHGLLAMPTGISHLCRNSAKDGLTIPSSRSWHWPQGELASEDASIIHEAHLYRAATSTPSAQSVRIWTLDAGLQASF